MEFRAYKLTQSLASQAFLSKPALEEVQTARLRAMVRHSGQSVPFHASRFRQAGVSIGSLALEKEFRKIPIMTRADLSLPQSELCSSSADANSLIEIRTSGTTGAPARVFISPEDKRWRQAVRGRASEALGIEQWFRTAHLLFNDRSLNRSRPLRDRVAEWAVRRRSRYQRPFYFTYSCSEILDELERYSPMVVEGTPAYLENLAQAAKSTKSLPRLEAVVSAVDLLDRSRRKRLERFYGCPVYDIYGSRDAGVMGWECPERSGLHMNIDTSFYEVVKDGREVSPGESGELLITSLTDFAMPLVRYRVGDVVRLGGDQCACGRGLPMLKMVEGRASDFLELGNGRSVSPHELLSAVQEVEGVPAFQMVAERSGTINVRLFLRKQKASIGESVRTRLEELFGPEVRFDVSLVEETPKAKVKMVVRE